MTNELKEQAIYDKADAAHKVFMDKVEDCLKELVALKAPRPAEDSILGVYLRLMTTEGSRLAVETDSAMPDGQHRR